jgi:hypothetical protein
VRSASTSKKPRHENDVQEAGQNQAGGEEGRGRPAAKPEPSDAERETISRAKVRLSERPRRVALTTETIKGKLAEIGPSHSDHVGWLARLQNAFGTTSIPFARQELASLIMAISPEGADAPSDAAINAVLAVVDGVQPDNEIEAMLAGQMAVTHALSLELLGRARRAEQLPQFESAANYATKMLRTFAVQAETLAKLRRGGEQKVTVEHVHVHPGGQAIVGNVQHPGGGVAIKSEEQAHGPAEPRALGHSPSAPLWGEEPGRAAVPASGGEGQDAMHHARRGEGQRRPEG